MQGQLYEFASKYWNFIDQDGSGGLNFNEFKYTFAGFAAVDSRVIMKAFDADNNGLLGYYFFLKFLDNEIYKEYWFINENKF